jgi:hypothetical protein
MSSILIKINFLKKSHLSKKILDNIITDIIDCVDDKKFFNGKGGNENIFMAYEIELTTPPKNF